MEKIIVNPQQVRALGDIVSPKGVADFEKYCCTLEKSTDLYTSEFLPGARLVIDYPGSVSVDDDDFTVDVLLEDDSGAVISGASVYCTVNGDLSSETTDSNGEASFTLSCDGESTEYWFRIWYAGTDSLAGAICRGVVTVVDYESVDFSLMVDNPVLCGGEFAEFVAKVDELNGSGRVPVSGAVVEFYMDVGEVEPASISLVSNKDTLSYADGDSTTLTATVLGSDSQPYEGATVVFKAYKNGTLVETIGSDTTDASGVAIVSYSSKGSGDLNIKASVGSIVSETYSIQDMTVYDNATSDKSSMYISRSVGNGKSCTVSYANNEYHLTASGSNVSWYGVSPVSLSTSDDWEITIISKAVNTKGTDQTFLGVGFADGGANHIEHILYPKSPTSYAVYGYGSPNSYLISSTSVSLQQNYYYTMKVQLVNGVVSLKVFDGDTKIIDNSYNLPSNYEDITVYPVVSCFGNTSENNVARYFKEYSVKPL